MSRQKGGKTLIITDDEEEEQDELNPFSFKEFLRWKNQDQNHHPDQDQTHRKEEELEQSFQSFVDSSSSLCTNEEDDADEDIEEEETSSRVFLVHSTVPQGLPSVGPTALSCHSKTVILQAADNLRAHIVLVWSGVTL
ncbi:hypothetical protein AMECASPLE_005888 [Ameca splendens]|uniref:Uncharacterized protein n=1 Tax=Ameca splendens TaxID=208324 RepID=A0ABV0YB43_9TELE